MTQLYVLAQEYQDAAAALSELDLDEQTVADTLDSMAGDLEAKAINVAMVIRNRETTALAIEEAIATMSKRLAAARAGAAHMRAYLLGAMTTTGIQKIESPWFRLSVRDNPLAVDIFDPSQVPSEFMAPAPPPPPAKPDKPAIKAAIKAGVTVPGARLTQAQRLEIS